MAFSGAFSRVFSPPLGEEEAAPAAVWYDPNGVFAAAGILGDIWAWRAIDTPGSPWGAGPANYAASLIDENQGLVLVEGNGAVPWAGPTGWGFVVAASQYFNTNLIPTNDQNYSAFVQFKNFTNGFFVFDVTNGLANSEFGIQGQSNPVVRYRNGGNSDGTAIIASGNLGLVGNRGYKNGAVDTGVIAAWGNPSTFPIFIACRNNVGVAQLFGTLDICAIWICRSNPAIVQGEALSLATAMSQL